MSRSIARIETEHASTYLQQLCKHFAHKLPVEITPSQGRIPFNAGTCTLAADDARLTLEVEAASADDLARVQDVVERHLVRFAFRDPPKVQWSAVEAAE
jgi:uncharacterized protein